MPKHVLQPITAPECSETLNGLSTIELAKKGNHHPKPDPKTRYHDPWCDPQKPKTILYEHVAKAHRFIKKMMPYTELKKAHDCATFKMNLYFKLETGYKTGSFHERGAMYALHMLTDEQRNNGVVTASLGNWAMALTSEARKMNVPITVFFPAEHYTDEIEKCQKLGAEIILTGKTLTDTSRGAVAMINDTGIGTYINGYDHPHVIAGEGTIAIEILEQLPKTEVILVPVGGGGLLAGVAAVVKKIRPDILIYGVETNISSCFFKALDSGYPYTVDVGYTHGMPTAGYNAFHTAQSLIDKMILVQEDWISQALGYLMEEERLVVERMGALGLAVIFAGPKVMPELRSKNVVCILSGSNIDRTSWPRAIQRAKVIEGRLLSMEVACPFGDLEELTKVFRVLSNLRCNVTHYFQENSWVLSNEINHYCVTITVETRGWRHANTIKQVMIKLFPGICKFSEEACIAQELCQCYPTVAKLA